ncbi:unnamed protein product [Pseudo-nitzschia multistriata]|uniref:Uncharacterized protein n=1 Tax=Pseudo-nitzschia multistriata TaxID=183589 RepID=A0A448ZC45_9STRA|nr:unnamed protein product [Pseudo-nitzschia multistriata]
MHRRCYHPARAFLVRKEGPCFPFASGVTHHTTRTTTSGVCGNHRFSTLRSSGCRPFGASLSPALGEEDGGGSSAPPFTFSFSQSVRGGDRRRWHSRSRAARSAAGSAAPDHASNTATPPAAAAKGENQRRPRKGRKKFVPRTAAVRLTEAARTLFRRLLAHQKPPRAGILLDYQQSSSGQPRMVFSFRFVASEDELHENDEGVSLEVVEVETRDPDTGESTLEMVPKPPAEAAGDGLPKLYVHHNAFLKVLGATVDVDAETMTPRILDKEGFELDANA